MGVDSIAFTKVALPFGGLGNMSPHSIRYQDKVWRTAEALFQALRFASSSPTREKIRAEKSPMGAKMLARRYLDFVEVVPRSDADIANMRLVLQLKHDQHQSIQRDLQATGSARIIEDCTARPNDSGLFWGAKLTPDGWVGENKLGVFWMELRDRSAKPAFALTIPL